MSIAEVSASPDMSILIVCGVDYRHQTFIKIRFLKGIRFLVISETYYIVSEGFVVLVISDDVIYIEGAVIIFTSAQITVSRVLPDVIDLFVLYADRIYYSC